MAAAAESFLHPAELGRYVSFKSLPRKRSFLMGRLAAKNALSAYYNEPDLSSFQVVNGIMKHPVLRYLSEEHAGVSITHNNEFAAAVVFPDVHPVSIDIESVEPGKAKSIGLELTEEESRMALNGRLSREEFYTAFWTIKEAISKIIHTGAMIPFTLLAVEEPSFLNDSTIETHFKNFGQYKATSFIVKEQVLSFVYPKRTCLELELSQIRSCFAAFAEQD